MTLRSHVSFRHPAAFVPVSDVNDDILGVEGAGWFVKVLQRIPDLQVDAELCQEDWGVVIFAQRNGVRFWIGLSYWSDDDVDAWLAHCHHASFAWLQRFTSSGKREFKHLVKDLHDVLSNDPVITKTTWYEEREMNGPGAKGSSIP